VSVGGIATIGIAVSAVAVYTICVWPLLPKG